MSQWSSARCTSNCGAVYVEYKLQQATWNNPLTLVVNNIFLHDDNNILGIYEEARDLAAGVHDDSGDDEEDDNI